MIRPGYAGPSKTGQKVRQSLLVAGRVSDYTLDPHCEQ